MGRLIFNSPCSFPPVVRESRTEGGPEGRHTHTLSHKTRYLHATAISRCVFRYFVVSDEISAFIEFTKRSLVLNTKMSYFQSLHTCILYLRIFHWSIFHKFCFFLYQLPTQSIWDEFCQIHKRGKFKHFSSSTVKRAGLEWIILLIFFHITSDTSTGYEWFRPNNHYFP